MRHDLAIPTALCAMAILLSPPDARAQETLDLSFHGYGTLGGVYSSEDRADFVWNDFRPEGPGRSQRISPDVDSRLGGQLTLRVTPELMTVVQAVVEQNHEDEYTPQLEWAYVQYAPTQESAVRVGRRPIGLFMVSEHRKVSYSNPWIRPPVELYGMSPVFSMVGFDMNHRIRLGSWTHEVQMAFGWTEEDFDGGSAEVENAWILANTLRRGELTLRAALASGMLDVDAFDALFDGFRAFGPQGQALAERYEVDDTGFEFVTLGAEYDPGSWFGMAELGWVDFHSVLGEKLAGYLTLGRRLGPVTPYATYSRAEALSETSDSGLPLSALPPEAAEEAAPLNAGLNDMLAGIPLQQNVAVGARWDVRTGVALKLQVDFVDLLETSRGMFTNRDPSFEPGGSARLASFATTFVF